MTFNDSVQVAAEALTAHGLRSALTTLGVVIGVAAVVTMAAVGEGAQERVAAQIRSLGAHVLLIRPGAQDRGGVLASVGTRQTLTEQDALAIAREVRDVLSAAPGVNGPVQVVHGNRNWASLAVGATPEYLSARGWQVAAGRLLSAEDERAAASVVVLGQTVARHLFGEASAVGEQVRVGKVPATVVGVLRRKGQSPFGSDQDDVVFLPLATARLRVLGSAGRVNPKAVDFVFVQVASHAAIADSMGEIRSLLRARHRLVPDEADDFAVQDLAALVSAEAEAANAFKWLLGVVAAVSLLVGGIGIMNTMLVSVAERTREIGIRLSVGASPQDILRQFLVEALTLCAVGGLLGTILGVGLAFAVEMLTGWPIRVRAETIALAVGASATVGLVFGIYPARRAARLEPVDALRAE